MPRRNLPQTLTAAVRVLRKCRDQYQNTPVAADRAVSAAIFAQLDAGVPAALLTTIERELGEAQVARAQAGPLTAAKQAAAADLRLFVSHFHQVLDLGIARERWVPGVRAHYGRPTGGGTLPPLNTDALLDAEADKIVRGEALRLAAEGAGYVAMSNPSAGEVGGFYSVFRGARLNASSAEENVDEEMEDVSDLTAAALELALDVFDSVEFFYRKDTDGGSFRRKCRRWGVEYIYGPGEPPDDPVPAAPGAPDFTLGDTGSRQITFTWSAVAGAGGYRLYGQGPGATVPTLLGQYDALTATVVLENATSGEDWLFTLTAFNDTGESPPSPAQPAALP